MTHQKAEVFPGLTPCTILASQYGLNPCVSLALPSPAVHLTGEMLLKHSYLSLLQLWTGLLLQFLIGKNSSAGWEGGKKATNELKTEHRPRCHDTTSEVSKSLRSHLSILFLKGDCCSKIEMDRNAWSHYPMSAVQQLPTERCQKAEVGDQSSARLRKELISSFTDHICPSGKQPVSHPTQATKCGITAPKFQSRQACPPLPK